ncbi:MAG TPA: response regulator [Ktedonobacterales bacterium]|jgi:two-component system alkaline phosphatase synthesis response regulator PhoP|nr:response regulator [Ktedonobacterales bacterium]
MTAPDQTRKKILVIDDSPTILDVIRLTLEQQGTYRVVVAENGVQGLEQYYREQPDCVIVDVMMPHMDGFQFTRVLRGDSQASHVALVILTTLSSGDKRLTGLLSGADDYVTKPFKGAELCATIERAMATTPEERAQRLLRMAEDDLAT